MDGLEAQSEPLTVSVRDGEVVMTGSRVAVALTAEAARRTAERLASAAEAVTDQPKAPASDS
jgi:hypothetical protein